MHLGWEVIRDALVLTTILKKAIILSGCSTGLSVNEIINLGVGYFLEVYDQFWNAFVMKNKKESVCPDQSICLNPLPNRIRAATAIASLISSSVNPAFLARFF